jgi:uncharacterized membrane protein YcaP (DUF421 family)
MVEFRHTTGLGLLYFKNFFAMDILIKIFGEGKDLTAWQMSSRGIVVFIIALLLIRVSGRRSFGIRAPLDNIIIILLGAILSRAVVGASEFVPVIVSCFVIVVMHRCVGWLIVNSETIGRLVESDKIILYEKGKYVKQHLKRVQLTEEDVMQGVRKSALTEDLNQIKHIYIERNGEISAIKK